MLEAAALTQALAGGAVGYQFAFAPPVPAALGVEVDGAAIDPYVAAYRDHGDRVAALDRLTLETWLLARRRVLHDALRFSRGARAATDHVAAWNALAEHAFLADRRVRRGRAEPDGLYEELAALLVADAGAFTPEPHDTAGLSGDDALRAATRATARVLGLPPDTVQPSTVLADVPTFGSFRLAEIVERVEEELSIELDPSALHPARLRSVGDLADAARAVEVAQ